MTNRLSIVNGVLNKLGRLAVSNIDVDPTAQLIDQTIDNSLPEILMEAEWNFAKKYQALAQTPQTQITPDWKYAYTLPFDFIRMGETPIYNFTIYNTYLLTNTLLTDPGIYYVSYDPNNILWERFSPLFTKALIYLTTAEVALPATNDKDIFANAQEKYREYLGKAVFSNSMQEPAVVQPYNQYDRRVF